MKKLFGFGFVPTQMGLPTRYHVGCNAFEAWAKRAVQLRNEAIGPDGRGFPDCHVHRRDPQCLVNVDFVEELPLGSAAIGVSGGCQRGKAGPLRLMWRRSAPEGG